MKITVTGELTERSEVQTFGSGFKKRTFVVTETSGQYPTSYQFELHKENVSLVSKMRKGDQITVTAYVSSSRGPEGGAYANKWFTTLKAVSVETAGQSAPVHQPPPRQAPPQAPRPAQPQASQSNFDDDGDGIPF